MNSPESYREAVKRTSSEPPDLDACDRLGVDGVEGAGAADRRPAPNHRAALHNRLSS